MGKLVPMGVNTIINGAEALGLVREVLQTVQNVYEIKEMEQTRRAAISADLEYKIAQIERNIKELELDHEVKMKLIVSTFDLLDKICSNPNPTEIHVRFLEHLVQIINSSKNKQIEGGCL